VKRRLLIAAAAVVVIFLIGKFVVTPFLVVGESMTPTLQHMELCLMQRVYHYRPQRSDIVVFRTADDPPLYLVKRVVALPGEIVGITNGIVQINGQPLPESYTPPNPNWELPATIVPADKIYVIGDNRSVAIDETVHGLVATRLVKARLLTHWRWKR
jgi:signal peptidase I